MDPLPYFRLKIMSLAVCSCMTASTLMAQQTDHDQAYHVRSPKPATVKIPETVFKTVKRQYPGFSIKNAEKLKVVVSGKKSYHYILCVEKGSEFYKVKIGEDGKIINKSWVTIY